jgi:heme exporter protein B
MNVLAAVGFVIVLGLEVESVGLLAATLGLGALGLAGATTLLSALIARAASQGPLLPVLAFPLLVPLLLTVIRITQRTLLLGGSAGPWAASLDDLVTLAGYAGAVITASVLLFDFVWND